MFLPGNNLYEIQLVRHVIPRVDNSYVMSANLHVTIYEFRMKIIVLF